MCVAQSGSEPPSVIVTLVCSQPARHSARFNQVFLLLSFNQQPITLTADNHSVGEHVPQILRNLKVHYRVLNNGTLDPIFSHPVSRLCNSCYWLRRRNLWEQWLQQGLYFAPWHILLSMISYEVLNCFQTLSTGKTSGHSLGTCTSYTISDISPLSLSYFHSLFVKG